MPSVSELQEIKKLKERLYKEKGYVEFIFSITENCNLKYLNKNDIIKQQLK